MLYVAHAGVKLKTDSTNCEKDVWHYIKTVDNIEYRWRLRKNLTYEVVAGTFSDPKDALTCAKQIYITLLYNILKSFYEISDSGCDMYEQRFYQEEYGNFDEFIKNEKFFFWNKNMIGGQYGPGVYEVDGSLDDFDNYKFEYIEWSQASDSDLSIDNIDEYIFTYSKESQALLNSVILAENSLEYGMKMTVYCGILEHLAVDGMKSDAVQNEIDKLIDHVEQSQLSKEEKEQLTGFLKNGKLKSSRQKCKELVRKYAKPEYGKHKAEKIFSDAYTARSIFSHGEKIDYRSNDTSHYIKYVVLDVIKGYIREKENNNV